MKIKMYIYPYIDFLKNIPTDFTLLKFIYDAMYILYI